MYWALFVTYQCAETALLELTVQLAQQQTINKYTGYTSCMGSSGGYG